LQIKQAEPLHGRGLVATQNACKIGDSVSIHVIITQNSLTELNLK